MGYRVHRFAIRMTNDQLEREPFLNGLEGDVVAIVPNVTLSLTAPRIDFLLVVEEVR